MPLDKLRPSVPPCVSPAVQATVAGHQSEMKKQFDRTKMAKVLELGGPTSDRSLYVIKFRQALSGSVSAAS